MTLRALAGAKKKKSPQAGAAVGVKKADLDFKPDAKGIRCPNCKTPGVLFSQIKIRLEAPLAKGGSVKMAGLALTQKGIKERWEKQKSKDVRCKKCDKRFVYVDGEGLQEAAA